jgi:replicative DNA helicase
MGVRVRLAAVSSEFSLLLTAGSVHLAKHRNGPTATVTVAFQGHYSRFVDMAPG